MSREKLDGCVRVVLETLNRKGDYVYALYYVRIVEDADEYEVRYRRDGRDTRLVLDSEIGELDRETLVGFLRFQIENGPGSTWRRWTLSSTSSFGSTTTSWVQHDDGPKLDFVHLWWSIFTLQWPCVAFAALVGRW